MIKTELDLYTLANDIEDLATRADIIGNSLLGGKLFQLSSSLLDISDEVKAIAKDLR